MKVEWSNRAEFDLATIWHYIAAENKPAAKKLYYQIRDAVRNLAHMPYSGAKRDDLREGLRVLIVRNYLVYYIVEDDLVTVLRVAHGARNQAALPLDEEE